VVLASHDGNGKEEAYLAAAVGGVAALSAEFFGEVGAFGEGAIWVAVGVVIAGVGLGEVRVCMCGSEEGIVRHRRERRVRPWQRSHGARPWVGWRSWRG
jgi:hypothetical protein